MRQKAFLRSWTSIRSRLMYDSGRWTSRRRRSCMDSKSWSRVRDTELQFFYFVHFTTEVMRSFCAELCLSCDSISLLPQCHCRAVVTRQTGKIINLSTWFHYYMMSHSHPCHWIMRSTMPPGNGNSCTLEAQSHHTLPGHVSSQLVGPLRVWSTAHVRESKEQACSGFQLVATIPLL